MYCYEALRPWPKERGEAKKTMSSKSPFSSSVHSRLAPWTAARCGCVHGLSPFDSRRKQRRRPETDQPKNDESEHRDGVRPRTEGNG